MELRQLEYFVQVSELGSFTRASNFLSVGQPVLSRQVRALELEFRQSLLERNGRGVTLTEAGKRLFEHGRVVLAQIERVQFDMEESRGACTGRLVVALPASVGMTLTAPLAKAFSKGFPKATLCVVEGLSTYAIEWLAAGRVDCAVVYTVPTSSAIELAPVLNEQLFLVSSSKMGGRSSETWMGDEISLAEVAERCLVMPSRPHAIRMLVEGAMTQASLKSRVALEIESIPAILSLVRETDLHAIMSLNAVRAGGREDDFHVRPIGKPVVQGTLWIATSAQRPCGPLLSQAVSLLQALLREHWAS